MHLQSDVCLPGRQRAGAGGWSLPPSPSVAFRLNACGRHIALVEADPTRQGLSRRSIQALGARVTILPSWARLCGLVQSFAFDLIVFGPEADLARSADPRAPSDPGLGDTPVLMIGKWRAVLKTKAGYEPIVGTAPDCRYEDLLRLALQRAPLEPLAVGRLSIGRAAYDLERSTISINGFTQRLPFSEAHILRMLALNQNRPVGRLQLRPDQPDGRAVDVGITRLRRRLELDPANPRHILTIRGSGYKLVPGLSP